MSFLRTVTMLIAPLLGTLAPTAAMAFIPHPKSWKELSDDGRYVLVMVSPLAVDEDAGHESFDADEIREIRRIRASYSQSGLYRTDGTAAAIWTLPYYDWTHEVDVASDGKHLVIADDNWQRSHEHVVSFYSNGKKLASYYMTDLISSIDLKSAVNWPNRSLECGGIEFDGDSMTFTSYTNQGEMFVFDVMTGKMIRQWSPFPRIIAGSVMAAIATASFFLIRQLRRERWTAESKPASDRG